MTGPDAGAMPGDAGTAGTGGAAGATGAAAEGDVTLLNCDREPIHIPGAIQPHGALLAFDAAGRLRWASENAALLLGAIAPPGEALQPAHLHGNAGVHAAIALAIAAPHALPTTLEATLGARPFDLILHRSGAFVVAEFELRADDSGTLADFALLAHRSIERLRRQDGIDALLAVAVEDVRALTGFDRVVAYRFRHDGSGDVVAERRADDLEPFLGRRFPASDIPAQARRLYTVNTLRLIADVRAAAVPLRGSAHAAPLDLSHAVLRAVSPIHLEYLANMGVRASMSISIVVQGRLWGMVACHHRAPWRVRYAVRMACDVIAQVLAANVQTLQSRLLAERHEAAAALRARALQDVLQGEDFVAALASAGPALLDLFDAHAAVAAEGARLAVVGTVPAAAAGQLVRWLAEQPLPEGGLLHFERAAQLPAALREALGGWCGALGLCVEASSQTWLVLLRREQVEAVRWGGRPEKHVVAGPRGPRLTPRGSFDVWREEVRGVAEPWDEADLHIARQLLEALVRSVAARMAELGRARNQLLAVLGHDLRDPLHSISMAARVLERSAGDGRLGQRIQSSSGRMQRLVADVLDLSRLQAGLGLAMRLRPLDLVALARDVLEEGRLAHPGVQVRLQAPAALAVQADADRMAQLLANLLGNARHHGQAGEAVVLLLAHAGDGGALIEVRNVAAPIAPALARQLFSPFKRGSLGNERNRGGLGLGLYIAHQIATGHGGSIGYRHEAPHVVFGVRLPPLPDAPGPAPAAPA